MPLGQCNTGLAGVGPFLADIGRPVNRVFAFEVGQHRVERVLAGIERAARRPRHVVAQRVAQALCRQLVGIQLAGARVLGNLLVHQRLRQCRRVLFVVSQFAKAYDVKHHIALELHAVLQRQLSRQHHRLWVVAVDMQHRRLDHLDDVRAIQRGARVARVAGGKANLVVDHDMHRAASRVAARFGQRQRLHHDALSGKSGVAVHQDRQHLLAFGVGAAVHAGAHRAFDHRIDNFEVRRIERQAQMHRAAGRGHVGAEALVVFHVAAGQVFRRGVLELGKQIGRHFAQRIDQHIEPTAVRHADHDFLQTNGTAPLNQLVHRRNKALAALQRKALLADKLGVQETLQPLGRSQPVQNVFLLFCAEVGFRAHALEFLLPPAFLVLVGDIHVLGAERAAVSLAQRVHQLTQAHAVLAEEGVAGVEHGFLIGIAETVKGRLQLRNGVALSALQRIEVGPVGTDVAVGGNQLLHRCSLASHLGVGAGQNDPRAALPGALGKGIDHRQMGNVFGIAAIDRRNVLQGVKIIAPAVGHTARMSQVVLVHFFHVRGVAAKKMGVGLIGLVNRRARRRRASPLGLDLTHVALTFVSLEETLAG